MMASQLAYFKERGVHNTVLTCSMDKKTTFRRTGFGELIRTPLLNRSRPDAPSARSLAQWLHEIVANIRPDIIYCHNLTFPYGPARTRAIVRTITRRFPGIPLIEHAHNAQNAQHRSVALQRGLARLPWDAIVCVSTYAKSQFVKQGISGRRINVIYNGIDLKQFKPLPKTRAALLKRYNLDPKQVYAVFPSRPFTSAGELNIKKGFGLAARALSLAHPAFNNLHLLAPSNEGHNPKQKRGSLNELNAFTKKIGISARVALLPEFSRAEMPTLYALGDIVVAPSTREAFGLVYAEAMAMQKPVIAVKSGAAPEIITHNKTGFLIERPSARLLAHQITQVMRMPKTSLNALTATARKQVQKKFSSRLFGERTLELCARMLKKTRASSS